MYFCYWFFYFRLPSKEMASLLTKMFLKSEVLPDGRLRCIVPPSRPGMWQRTEESILIELDIGCKSSILPKLFRSDLSKWFVKKINFCGWYPIIYFKFSFAIKKVIKVSISEENENSLIYHNAERESNVLNEVLLYLLNHVGNVPKLNYNFRSIQLH